MRRGPHLLIGISSISGWGLFTKGALKKGDYVGEYVGEAISQGEADRRGLLADHRGSSYIFMVASDLNIDSSKKGNQTRFINHSSSPNVEPKSTCGDFVCRDFVYSIAPVTEHWFQVLFVKGEQRIGFFARQDIEEQTELLFDYRYKAEMDNDLVELRTPASGVGWMDSWRPF
jgi:SET domain-containing protein